MPIDVSCPACGSEDLKGEHIGEVIALTCLACGKRWERTPGLVCPRCASAEVDLDSWEGWCWDDEDRAWSHTEEIDFRCLKCHKTWHEAHRAAVGDDGSLSKSELMRWTLAELQTEAKNKGIDTNGLRKAALVKAILEDDEIDYWSAEQLQRMPEAALDRAAKDWGIATSGRSREVVVALILREQEKDAASL